MLDPVSDGTSCLIQAHSTAEDAEAEPSAAKSVSCAVCDCIVFPFTLFSSHLIIEPLKSPDSRLHFSFQDEYSLVFCYRAMNRAYRQLGRAPQCLLLGEELLYQFIPTELDGPQPQLHSS